MSAAGAESPAVLCVDDEPNVLDGLTRHLRRHFRVSTATSGAAGLETIARDGPFAVVVSDMRMPEMDGAAFLQRVRENASETVRVLLTGHADLQAAIAAVNQANIFRFLCKPCPPEVLVDTLRAAAEQHRLVTAERVLLQDTLRGSVRMLSDVLSLASPTTFGRVTRARQRVSQVMAHLGIAESWETDVATMLSQIGSVTLPAQTAEKMYHGQTLSFEEQAMTARLPVVAANLLGHIPRLETVRDIVLNHAKQFDGGGHPAGPLAGEQIPWAARLLKVVFDLDTLEAQGLASEVALQTLRGRSGWYDPALLDALGGLLGAGEAPEVREVRLRDVRPGMVFAADVTTRTGMLLIARGQEVTAGMLERIRNFSEHLGVKDPVLMNVPASVARAGAT